jgi:hypothetical protein
MRNLGGLFKLTIIINLTGQLTFMTILYYTYCWKYKGPAVQKSRIQEIKNSGKLGN